MKKILLITENLGAGGAERQICGLAAMLTHEGYPSRLITYVKNQFYESYLNHNNVDYQFVPQLTKKSTRVFNMIYYIHQYKPDVVISYLPAVNQTVCLTKPFIKSKLIVSERNNNTTITSKDRIRFNLYRLADLIVPNSYCQAKFIKKNFSYLKEKTHPIINFVDVGRFKSSNTPHNNRVLRIITVARFSPQKNVLLFLQAVRIIKDLGLNVHFDWFGDKTNNPEYWTTINTEYKRLCISDYISLHSSKMNIEEEYQKADIFCLPSLFEGYPNVVVEAMSCGLPVICSNVYENPYIIEEGVNGYLFDPHSINDIVAAIRKIASLKPDDRLEMGMRNRELCMKRNTKESFLKAYVEIIESL